MRVQQLGKCQCQRSVVAMSAGRNNRLLFIEDSISGRQFLCDTGAQHSVIPALAVDTLSGSHGPPMQAANNSPICTFGSRRLTMCFQGQRFNWDFVIAKVAFPILGADFLCAHGLLVDIRNRRLIDATTCMHTQQNGPRQPVQHVSPRRRVPPFAL